MQIIYRMASRHVILSSLISRVSTQTTLLRLRPFSSATSQKECLVGPLAPTRYDPNRYIITFRKKSLSYESKESVIQDYVRTLATVVGSEEEAKKKIYFVSCEWDYLSFGAEIDKHKSEKLGALPNVYFVHRDLYMEAREKFRIMDSTTVHFPLNCKHRLFDMFHYHCSSECNMTGDSGHWLINIRNPDGGFASADQVVDHCVKLLSEFVGSEKEAKKRMYVIWCVNPYGFGAEMDEATSKKLEGLQNVLDVIPDYAFDIKDKDFGILHILPGKREPQICYQDLEEDDDDL